jgi:hypothetical protein
MLGEYATAQTKCQAIGRKPIAPWRPYSGKRTEGLGTLLEMFKDHHKNCQMAELRLIYRKHVLSCRPMALVDGRY